MPPVVRAPREDRAFEARPCSMRGSRPAAGSASVRGMRSVRAAACWPLWAPLCPRPRLRLAPSRLAPSGLAPSRPARSGLSMSGAAASGQAGSSSAGSRLARSGLPGAGLAVSGQIASGLAAAGLAASGPVATGQTVSGPAASGHAASGLAASGGALCRPDVPFGPPGCGPRTPSRPGPAPGRAGAVQLPVDRPSPTAFQVCVDVTSAAGSLTASTE